MSEGKDGAGVIPFKWGPATSGPKSGSRVTDGPPGQWKTAGRDSKDIIAMSDNRNTPMKQGVRGRVMYGGKSRTGQKDGTGPES